MNHPYLITAGFVCLVAIVAVGLAQRRRRAQARQDAELARLKRGANAPEIDEDWEAHEFGEEGRR